MTTKIIRGSGGGKSGGGAGYTPTEDPDSLRSRQTAKVLDCICEGEIQGLDNGLQSIFLDDTPLMNSDGSYNFADVSVNMVTGTQAQSYIPDFTSVETEVPVNVEVTYSTPVVRQITDANVNAVRVSLAWNRLTYQDPTNGDLRGSDVEYKIAVQANGGGFVDQYLKSESPVRATPPDPNTPISSSVSTSSIFTTQGGTSRIVGNCEYTRPFDNGGGIEGGAYYRCFAKFIVQYKLSSSGTWLNHTTITFGGNTDGGTDITGNFDISGLDPAVYNVRLQRTSIYVGATVKINFTDAFSPSTLGVVAGKSTSRYVRAHLINLTGTPPWDIRISRLTPDSTESNLVDAFSFASYTEIINTKLSYPNTALIGIHIDAEQFSSIPRRGYEVKMLKVKIPSNYDPETRKYTGIWNGTFNVAWTDNPAWCFYDLLTNNRYGLGEFIPSTMVDASTLYTIGQYCDAVVPDGYGNMVYDRTLHADNVTYVHGGVYSGLVDSTGNQALEPRFTCNLYIQTREEAFKVINNMASIFRGMVYWYSNLITSVQDSPDDVWSQFTNADVIDGFFNYEGSAAKTRHTVALVSWNDPNNGYELNIEYVEDSEEVALRGIVETEVVAMGCTSRGQAARLGRWLLYTEKYETEVVTFKTGLEGTRILPGKIIKISDQYRAGVRHGGRIVSATTGTVTLDNPLVIGAGTYTISCVLPDGTLVDKTITNGAGTYTTVDITPAFTTLPTNYSIWVVSTSSVVPQTWRVISIVEDSKNIYAITAVEYNESKYNFVESGLILESPPVSIVTNYQAPITNLYFSESLYLSGIDTLGVRGFLSWQGSAAKYVVKYKLANENELSVEVKENSAELLGLYEGNYTFTVTAYNQLDIASSPVSMTVTVVGKLANPSNVINFSATLANDGVILEWDKVPDLDVRQYELAYGGTTWETATSLPSPVDNSYFTQNVPIGTTAWWVKALDTTGHFSTTAAVAYTTIQAPGICTVSSEVIDNNVLLRWTDSSTTLPINYYEVRKGASWVSGQSIGTISGRFSTIFETVSGTYTYWVTGFDTLGNQGTPAYVIASVSQPPDYKLENDHYTDFTDANATTGTGTELVSNGTFTTDTTGWTAGGGATLASVSNELRITANGTSNPYATQNITCVVGQTYVISCVARKGTCTNPVKLMINGIATSAITNNTTTNTLLIERFVATSTTHAIEVSISGTTINGETAFFDNISSKLAKTNCYANDANKLVFPVNSIETFAQHFTNNSWTTPQDQITAGYPIYVQPTLATGTFADEFDLGSIASGTVIQVSYDKVDVSGSVAVSTDISVKLLPGDAWTTYTGVSSVFTSNFRYVKTTANFTSAADTNVSYLNYLRTIVSVKQRTDSGTVVISSTGGTAVTFNLTFLDIDSITVAANSTLGIIAVYEFTDVPNPTGFNIRLFSLATGLETTGTATWTARGAA